MQIDIAAAERAAPAGVAPEAIAAELANRPIRRASAAIVLAASAGVLLASCLAVIMGLS